jgi:hypothetical protein
MESGMVRQSAGTTIVHGNIALGAPNGTTAANVSLSGGVLMGNYGYLTIGSHGSFSQSGGFLTNWYYLPISAGSHYSLTGGRMDVSQIRIAGTFEQTGGAIIVDPLSLDGTAVYNRTSGFLSVDRLFLDGDSQFHRGNSSFVNNTMVGFAGGTFFAGAGTNELGVLDVYIPGGSEETESTLDLESGGASVLMFRDSRDFGYLGKLTITNWAGSLNGGGADRIYVGTNQFGLTSDQLARITFANPAGLAAGKYAARILATGEVIPDSRPVLVYSRTANGLGLQFNWNTNSCQLLSSTNVAGPYQPISPQPTSPYNVTFSEPQRFFQLRCQ